jgi:hypothetical protein
MKAQRTIRRKSCASLGFLVLLTIGLSTACKDDSGFFPEASDFRFGAITVRAFDQRSSPVADATMELRDNRGNLAWEDLSNKTGDDGSVDFFILHPGFYTITIKPPVGYAVPASQSNPIGVEVKNNQTITVNVFLLAE